MRAFALVATLLVPFTAATAQTATAPDGEAQPALPPRGQADESPTQFSCTLQKLLKGEKCAWEWDAKAGAASSSVAAENSKKAATVARACASAATHPDETKADPQAQRACEEEIARTSVEKCGLEGRFLFEDDQGHLSTAARPCVDALLRVLARTGTKTSGGDAKEKPADDGTPAAPARSAKTPHTKTKSKAQAPVLLKI